MTDSTPEQRIIGMLADLHVARQEAAGYRKRADKLTAEIKEYMEGHGLAELVDGEHGIRATLQPRNARDLYDAKSMAEHSPAALVGLARLGLVDVDTASVDALRRRGGTLEVDKSIIDRWRMPGGIATYALLVEAQS